MVISVPAVEKERYYSVQLVDGNAYNYGYIGSRATGNDAGDYLVAGPDWKGDKPAGIKKIFRSTTPFSLTIFRTQLFNPEDMSTVANQESDQSLPYQLADVIGHEEKRRRFADALYSERFAG